MKQYIFILFFIFFNVSYSLATNPCKEVFTRMRKGVQKYLSKESPVVDLRGVNLAGKDLRGTNLRKVDLRGANLEGVNLAGAKLEGADFRGTNLEGTNLHTAYLESALYDSKTKFPKGFDPKTRGMVLSN